MSFLSNAIRAARRKRRWTQKELAARLGVTQSAVSFWESGKEIPSLGHQVRLVEMMPDLLTAISIQELNVLDRLQALERIVFDGKCGCAGCDCSSETEVIPISQALSRPDH